MGTQEIFAEQSGHLMVCFFSVTAQRHGKILTKKSRNTLESFMPSKSNRSFVFNAGQSRITFLMRRRLVVLFCDMALPTLRTAVCIFRVAVADFVVSGEQRRGGMHRGSGGVSITFWTSGVG